MLTIIGIVLVVISTILIYRAAKQNGHDAVKWTVVSVAAGVALQLIPILVGVVIGYREVAAGKTLNQMQKEILIPLLIVGIVCLVLNIIVAALLLKKVSKVVADQTAVDAAAPSADYDGGE